VISAITHIARLARAGFVFAREGVFGVVDPSLVPPPGQLALRVARLVERPGAKSGSRLSRALTRLGPAYLKLGQFLATRPDVVGVVMARDLESLQDRLPPFSQSGRGGRRDVAGAAAGAGICELRSRGRRGVDRPGSSR
jgi:ubiquinone biosynthesis protein